MFKQEPFRNFKTMGCNLCCLKVDKPKIPIGPVNPDPVYPNIPDYPENPENWIRIKFQLLSNRKLRELAFTKTRLDFNNMMSVKKYFKELNVETDMEKAWIIYLWVTNNFDCVRILDNNDDDEHEQDIEDILKTGKCEVQGYVRLYKELCKTVGVDFEALKKETKKINHKLDVTKIIKSNLMNLILLNLEFNLATLDLIINKPGDFAIELKPNDKELKSIERKYSVRSKVSFKSARINNSERKINRSIRSIRSRESIVSMSSSRLHSLLESDRPIDITDIKIREPPSLRNSKRGRRDLESKTNSISSAYSKILPRRESLLNENEEDRQSILSKKSISKKIKEDPEKWKSIKFQLFGNQKIRELTFSKTRLDFKNMIDVKKHFKQLNVETDMEKAWIIYLWVTNNFDCVRILDNNDDDEHEQDIDDILKTGKCELQAYVTLYKDLCQTVGVDFEALKEETNRINDQLNVTKIFKSNLMNLILLNLEFNLAYKF